ncbi:uncharacterized protein LOC123448697 [Hordeum vulgare subsp. vulgare]|uniref:uncharacterized protein LOC123448697 n=1 Tax=Hordeum vulgare subsp. vulgare TaxID=112509 RepID=UPI001D1A360A|nr:uncharacterized protein LOC123448697 [Hordeum vulgare subsp. vulgare]
MVLQFLHLPDVAPARSHFRRSSGSASSTVAYFRRSPASGASSTAASGSSSTAVAGLRSRFCLPITLPPLAGLCLLYGRGGARSRFCLLYGRDRELHQTGWL